MTHAVILEKVATGYILHIADEQVSIDEDKFEAIYAALFTEHYNREIAKRS